MKIFALISVLGIILVAAGETRAQARSPAAQYDLLVRKAQDYYKTKNYKKSALTYSAAFKVMGWKGYQEDRYDAACSWAQAGFADSAFFHLDRIATRFQFANYNHLSSDKDLIQLHSDPRWETLASLVKRNKEQKEEQYNKPIVKQLDSIYTADQEDRIKLEEVMKTKGFSSKEFQKIRDHLIQTDSINLRKVRSILDQYGWLGPDKIGQPGNTTLFLVIQHADLSTQQQYLPMLRKAVANEQAESSHLALLEDRVALGEGRNQIYGSQIGQDRQGKAYILPLLDPDQVDKRRAKMGLEPIRDYVKQWNIKWDPAGYKKQLPTLKKEGINK